MDKYRIILEPRGAETVRNERWIPEVIPSVVFSIGQGWDDYPTYSIVNRVVTFRAIFSTWGQSGNFFLPFPREVQQDVDIPTATDFRMLMNAQSVTIVNISRAGITLNTNLVGLTIGITGEYTYSAGKEIVIKYTPRETDALRLRKAMRTETPIGFSVEATENTLRLVDSDADYLRNLFFKYGTNQEQGIRIEMLDDGATRYETIFNGYIDWQSFVSTSGYVEFQLFSNIVKKRFQELASEEIFFHVADVPTNNVRFESAEIYNVVSLLGSNKARRNTFDYIDNRSQITDDRIRGSVTNPGVGNRPAFLLLHWTRELPKDHIDVNFSFSFVTDDMTVPVGSAIRIWQHQTIQGGNLGWGATPIFTETFSQQHPVHFGITQKYEFTRNVRIRDIAGTDTTTFFSIELIGGLQNKEVEIAISAGMFYIAETGKFSAMGMEMSSFLQTLQDRFDFTGVRHIGRFPDFDKPPSPLWNSRTFHFFSGDTIGAVRNEQNMLGIYASPLDILNDFCKINAYSYDILRDGTFVLEPVEDVLTRSRTKHLSVALDIRDSFPSELQRSGVEIGYQKQDFDYPSFRQNFSETLVYENPNKTIGDSKIDLVTSVLRSDYLGLLFQRLYFKNKEFSGHSDNRYKDIWIVDTELVNGVMQTRKFENNLSGGGVFNVRLSPRRMAQRWAVYFSSIFGRWLEYSRIWMPNPTWTQFGEEWYLIDNGGWVSLRGVMPLSSSDNTLNNMVSTVDTRGTWLWNTIDDSANLPEKSNINLPQQRFFTPIERQLRTYGNIANIEILDRVSYDDENGVRQTIIVTDIETSEKQLDELNITGLLVP